MVKVKVEKGRDVKMIYCNCDIPEWISEEMRDDFVNFKKEFILKRDKELSDFIKKVACVIDRENGFKKYEPQIGDTVSLSFKIGDINGN